MNRRVAGAITVGALMLLAGCTYEDRANERETRVLQVCENWLNKAGYVVKRDEGNDWEASLEHSSQGDVTIRVVDPQNSSSKLGYILTDGDESRAPEVRWSEPQIINNKRVVFEEDKAEDKRWVHGCGVMLEGNNAKIKYAKERIS